jgi:hypothetical protein
MLGLFYIRKILNDKTGFIYSFLAIFLPTMNVYAGEIRMYSWAALFTALGGIYSYYAYKTGDNKKWILFALFSILSAYTHYYALLCVAAINAVLFFMILKKKTELKSKWFIFAIIQVILYIPWLIVFINQIMRVSGGFWISINYKNLMYDILGFFLKGNLQDIFVFYMILFVLTFFFIGLFKLASNKTDENKSKKLSFISITLIIFALPVLIGLILSISRPIFTPRYLMPMSGFILVALSISIGNLYKDKAEVKNLAVIFLSVVLVVSIANSCLIFNENYNQSNQTFINDIKENLEPNDIFIISEVTLSGLFPIYFPNNESYFYNEGGWSTEAYKAYEPQMKCITDLSAFDGYSGRIWIIDSNTKTLYDRASIKGNTFKIIKEQKAYEVAYKNNFMRVTLVNKGAGSFK